MSKSSQKKIAIAGIIVWLCSLIFYLYEFFLRTFVGTVAKSIISDLHLTSELFAVMSAAYYITYSLMQLPVGYLTDRFGAKKTIITAMLLCAASLLLFAFSQNFVMGLISRFLMGLGSSFGFVSLLIVITNWFPPNMYPTFIGISQFVGTLGPLLAAGPLVTVLKATGLGWRALLLRISYVGIIFAVIMLFLFRTKKRDVSSDMVIIESPKSIFHQLKRLFTNKQAWLIAFYSALSYESIDFLGAMWGTYYLQSRGLTLSLAGYAISAGWLGFAIGCPIITLFSDRAKRRKPFLVGCALGGLTMTALITYIALPYVWLYFVCFFGIGLAASALNLGIVVIIEHVEISVKSLALGFNNGLVILFGAIIPIATSFLVHLPANGVASPRNFIAGFSVLPLMYLLALILSLFFIEETFCRPKKSFIVVRP